MTLNGVIALILRYFPELIVLDADTSQWLKIHL